MIQSPKIAVLLETRRVFDRQILHGIGQYASLHGPWSFQVVSDRLEDFKPPPSFCNCTGIIARLNSLSLVNEIGKTNRPLIVVDGIGSSFGQRLPNCIAQVSADVQGVTRLAAKYFSSRHFERFALVGMPNQDFATTRSTCFGDLVHRLGHPFSFYPVDDDAELPWADERVALANWLEYLPKPIGILACDDERGLQVLEACRLARIAVPDQVAVMGVGNDELICEMTDPPLSSIALDAIDGGYHAAHALDQHIRCERQSYQKLVIVPNKVIARASTDFDALEDPRVIAARHIIRRNFSRDFSIDALVKAVGVSRRVLEIKFRQHTGRTIWKEVQELRIARAKQILKETELTVAEVAALSGYQSASHLVQLFARQTGFTPAKYRIAARLPLSLPTNFGAAGTLDRNMA